jgi:HEAT repeat protein
LAQSGFVPADLFAAARQLQSPVKTDRDAGEATLLSARDASIPALVSVLDKPGEGSIARVALLVSALKAREALPAIYALVEGRGPGAARTADERAFLSRALAEILDGRDAFDDRARQALEVLSVDEDRYVRAFAAQAFGALGDLRSKARVQALAQDKDAWVRERAGGVLRKLAETEALAQADVSPQDFLKLVQEAESEGGALKPYLDDLADHRRQVRDSAIAELVRAGKPAVPFLLDKLNQPILRARTGAATVLGRLQVTDAAGPLLIAATSCGDTPDETELKAVALRALANCLTGMEEGLATSILPMARDKDRFVRAAALLCLGRLADRAGLASIVAAILEDDPFVVESAAVALSEGVREEDVEIVRPLALALDKRPGPSPAVREAILIALSRVQITAAPLRVRVRHRVRKEVLGTTASTRKAAIVLLERLYDELDPPPLTVVDDVLSRLHDDHPEVRVVSASFIRALVEPGMAGVAKHAEKALARGEETVSLLILEALRRADTKEAYAVVASQKQRDGSVGTRAAELLVGWEPNQTEWIFVPKTEMPTTPPMASSQRNQTRPPGDASMDAPAPGSTSPTGKPSRVRAVKAAGDAAGDVVTPKDGPGR